MLWQRSEAREYVQRDVDWWTLVFFVFLFSQAGCLQYVGLTDRIAEAMLNMSGGGANNHSPAIIVLCVSRGLSAIPDNVAVVSRLAPGSSHSFGRNEHFSPVVGSPLRRLLRWQYDHDWLHS